MCPDGDKSFNRQHFQRSNSLVYTANPFCWLTRECNWMSIVKCEIEILSAVLHMPTGLKPLSTCLRDPATSVCKYSAVHAQGKVIRHIASTLEGQERKFPNITLPLSESSKFCRRLRMRLPRRVPWANISELDQLCFWIFADEGDLEAKQFALNRVRFTRIVNS